MTKEEKLELHYLAPYLPYNLKMKCGKLKEVTELVGIHNGKVKVEHYDAEGTSVIGFSLEHVKPILRPLFDLTKEIEGIGVPIEYNAFKHDKEHLIKFQNRFAHYKSVKYGMLQRLFEWHFDVFNLIESGLAIDINTLTANPNGKV